MAMAITCIKFETNGNILMDLYDCLPTHSYDSGLGSNNLTERTFRLLERCTLWDQKGSTWCTKNDYRGITFTTMFIPRVFISHWQPLVNKIVGPRFNLIKKNDYRDITFISVFISLTAIGHGLPALVQWNILLYGQVISWLSVAIYLIDVHYYPNWELPSLTTGFPMQIRSSNQRAD